MIWDLTYQGWLRVDLNGWFKFLFSLLIEKLGSWFLSSWSESFLLLGGSCLETKLRSDAVGKLLEHQLLICTDWWLIESMWKKKNQKHQLVLVCTVRMQSVFGPTIRNLSVPVAFLVYSTLNFWDRAKVIFSVGISWSLFGWASQSLEQIYLYSFGLLVFELESSSGICI